MLQHATRPGGLHRFTRHTGLAAALLVAACGGGGGASDIIPPFWLQGGVVFADLNGDGLRDVAVATRYIAGGPPHPGYVDVYLQTAAGVFAAPERYAVGPDAWGLSATDVDGDGRTDLLATSPSTVAPAINVISNSGGVGLLRQDPAQPGRFLGTQWLASGGYAEYATAADVDGDGRADLLVADGVTVFARAILMRQNPATPGTFLAPVSLPSGNGAGALDLATADINGDGRTDLALATINGLVVLYGNGGGGFAASAPLATGLRCDSIAVADLDGDGRADLVAACPGNSSSGGLGGATVEIFRQTAPGAFARTSMAVEDGAQRVVLGDLNADGLPDIAILSMVYQSQYRPSRVTVLLQSAGSRGTFAVSGVYDGTRSGDFFALGDANGDGLNDLVINDGPSVMLQHAGAPGTFAAPRILR